MMLVSLGVCLLALSAFSVTAYPLVIEIAAILARRSRAKTVDADKLRPTAPFRLVTVFHNEARIIEAKSLELDALGSTLMVSDGSSDGGELLAARALGSQSRVLVLPRLGKTGALRAALAEMPAKSGEILVLSDANVRFGRETLEGLLACFNNERVGAAAAAVLPEKGGPERWYWMMENRLRRNESEIVSSVGCSGALWAVRRDLLEQVDFAEMLCEDLWIPLVLRSRGMRIAVAEGPAAIECGTGDELVEARRRRRIMAGNLQVLARYSEVRLGLSRADRLLFFGHKTMRWLGPLFLIAGAACLSGEAMLRGHVVSVVGAMLMLAFVRPIRYFILMNLALAAGMLRRRDSGAWAPERNASPLSSAE